MKSVLEVVTFVAAGALCVVIVTVFLRAFGMQIPWGYKKRKEALRQWSLRRYLFVEGVFYGSASITFDLANNYNRWKYHGELLKHGWAWMIHDLIKWIVIGLFVGFFSYMGRGENKVEG